MIRAFESKGSDFEFDTETGEFDEAEFNEAEFDEAEVFDHRRRPAPRSPTRSRATPQRPFSSRFRTAPRTQRFPARPRNSSPRLQGSRPFAASRPFQWPARPGFSSRSYTVQRLPGQYRFGQRSLFSPITPRWNRLSRWSGRGGYPFGQPGYSAYPEPNDYDEPNAEPPMPPPLVLPPQIIPVPVAQPATAEPPPADPSAAPPAGAGTPAQDPPAAGEFYIEPEAFEFEPEVNENESEWGEFEGDFGEYEGSPPPQATTTACPPYQRGEVEKSKTQQGHLQSDVIQHPRGLLIADFAVDWRTPRATLKSDAELRAWLNTMVQVVRANPTTRIRISGYSDCLGNEKNNSFLRRGRAQRVLQLLQQMSGPLWKELRPKIAFIGEAPAGDYVATNVTIEGRAQNRGVLIEHTRDVNVTPTVVTGKKTISPFARAFEGPSSPLDALNKFFDAFTLVDIGLAIVGTTVGMEAFMLGAGIVITPLSPFVALGAPHEAALNELRKQQILKGLSVGIVLAADGRSNKWIEANGYVQKWPIPNINYPQYGKQLQGIYNTSLVAGIAHGRQFNTVATTNLFTLLTSQMTDYAKRDYLGYPNRMTGDQWRAYSKTWSARKWDDYYRLLAAIASRQIKLK